MRQSVAAAVVQQLQAFGVKAVFGVVGDDILPFLDALARDGRIRYIGAACESGAAFMAAAWARLTGDLGVCASSAPGTPNLMVGLADAALDRLPVLAVTGQVKTGQIGTPVKQYFNQQTTVGSIAPFSELVTGAAAAPRLLIRAVSQAILGRTAAHLSFPEDVWLQFVDASPGSIPALMMPSGAAPGLQGDIQRAIGLMRACRHPLMVLGSKARGLQREVGGLAERWGAAIVVAQDAKGVVPDMWPQVVGGIGEGWTPETVGRCDCILLVGTAGFERAFLPQAPVIQLESGPRLVDDVFLWDSLAGDIGQALRTLCDGLEDYSPDPSWGTEISHARQQRSAIWAADEREASRPIHPARLMAALRQTVAADAIIALDEGAFNHWFDRSFEATGQHILLSSRWRSMGAGLPAAVAAQLRFPDRQVIALTGDGGLLMSVGELSTAAKYDLPLTVVVVNDRAYALEVDKAAQKGLHSVGLGVYSPDFGRLSEACGVRGFEVDAPEMLEGTLRQALEHRGPALVDVKCRDVRLPRLAP